jgi:ABC-type multidrug transport system fused ATPase/permease subunit
VNYLHIFAILRRNFSFMQSARTKYLAGSLLSLLKMATAFLVPYLYASLLNMVRAGATATEVLTQMSMPFFLLVCAVPLISLGNYWQKTSANQAIANLQKFVFSHAIRLPLVRLDIGRADILLRATENARQAAGMFGGYTITMLMRFLCYTGTSFGLLLIYDVRYAMLGLVFCLVMFVLSTALNAALRELERNALSAEASSAARLMELVINLPAIKLFLLQPCLTGVFRETCENAYACRWSYKRLRGMTDGSIDFCSHILQPVALVLGTSVLGGLHMDFARLIIIAGLLDIMMTGMREFGFFIQFIQQSIVNSERVFELLGEPCEQSVGSPALLDGSANAVVSLQNVSFSYDGKNLALKNFTHYFAAGKTTVIVGPSGCGKSTLLKLLERLYMPDIGRIELYGVDISELNITSIRHMFAYIPQEAGLFDGTVEENICLGRAGCSRADLDEAAHRAALTECITATPVGYNTPIGENGARLSGGQRQRLAIARALVKDAPIYLIDEATSALDAQTELAVQTAFKHTLAGKTCIVAAHRLSTIADADWILYMDKGEILESGTHSELLARKGGYWSLYQTWVEEEAQGFGQEADL